MSIEYTKGQDFDVLARYMATSPDEMHAFHRIRDATDDHSVTENLRKLAIAAVGPKDETPVALRLRVEKNAKILNEKLAVIPGGVGNADYSALISQQLFAGQWIQSLQGLSVVDRLVAEGCPRFQANTKFVVAGPAGFCGRVVDEAHFKPVRNFSLTSDVLPPMKAACAFPITKDLLRMAPVEAQNFLGQELRAGVSSVINSYLISELQSGAASIPSSGGSPGEMFVDFANLFDVLDIGPRSRLLFCVSSQAAKGMTTANVDAIQTFPEMTVQGGAALGVPVMPVSELPAGTAMLLDASGIAVDTGTVTESLLRDGDIVVDTDPNDSPQVMTRVNLWQRNWIAILTERWFSFAVVRENAVAFLTDMTWGAVQSTGTGG